MKSRAIVAAFVFAAVGFSQILPGVQLIKELDGSGTDSIAGVGTDAQGNVYIAGSTYSPAFQVKNAIQPNIASSGLYRITGASWAALPLVFCSALALDPQNPSTIYAISNWQLLKSVDGGVSFEQTSLPHSSAYSVAIEPGNDQVLLVGTFDQGIFKSTDGGATWTAANNGLSPSNGQIRVEGIWIDPTNVNIVFAWTSTNGVVRSMDGAASWEQTMLSDTLVGIAFDVANPGTLYVNTYNRGAFKSVDYGQTFVPVAFRTSTNDQVLPDPIQPGRLILLGRGIYQSTDGGISWTEESTAIATNLVADTSTGLYYAFVDGRGTFRISSDLQTLTQIGPPSPVALTFLGVLNGQLYEASDGSSDVFVTKLDPLGNIVYSTYVGGTGADQALAMTVDSAGNVFVTGTTSSGDFPLSKGAYASSGGVFLFRLNPNGSLGYSTYFTGTIPTAVATDGNGSAWLLGNAEEPGLLPVTPGALATTMCCFNSGGGISIGPPVIPQEATLTRFSPSGSSLAFSTYVPGSETTSVFGTVKAASTLVVAPDGSAFVGGDLGFFHIDSTGSSLLSSMAPTALSPQAMTLGPDGSLYAAGMTQNLQATAGALQTTIPGNLPNGISADAIVRIDPTLSNILAATYFGAASVNAMTTDAAGNLYLGGSTAPNGLPTRTPFYGGFANPTGFVSELSGDLSSLVFSSYFGDSESFTVGGLGLGLNGSVWIGGATGNRNVWVNGLQLTQPPPLRIDSVENAASLLDGPISTGETIVVNGTGFGSDTQLSIGGVTVSPLSVNAGTITAVVPGGLPDAAADIFVQSGGAATNHVLMPVAVTSPGIFSQSGTGYGQGYILNKDGTLNSPSNPAAAGDTITIFATGVGPMTFTQCCAATDYPVNVYIDNIYCNGVAAIAGPVNGLPGSIYQITVYVPNPVSRAPQFAGQPLDTIVMQINGVKSQPGIAISIAH